MTKTKIKKNNCGAINLLRNTLKNYERNIHDGMSQFSTIFYQNFKMALV